MMMQRRAEAPAEWRARASERIAERAASLPAVMSAKRVALFLGKGDEVDTTPLVRRILEMKGEFAAPKTVSKERIEFHLARDFPRGFSPGRFGILEADPAVWPEIVAIASCDVVFVPGLAFDRAGNRIGYGKGHYDRVLPLARGAFKVGLAFSFQVLESVPAEEHDVPLDCVLTEAM